MKFADDLFTHMKDHWRLWLGTGSAITIVMAFLLAGSSVQVVQYIISAKSPAVTHYVACETGATIDLPALRISDDQREIAVSDVSTLSVEPDTTIFYQRTNQGMSIRLVRGVGGSTGTSEPAKPIARLVSHPESSDEIVDLDIVYSGTRLLIDNIDARMTVTGEGILEIGGTKDVTGLAVPLSDKARVSAVDTPFLGAERIKFVNVEIEPYSIIFTHPELITQDTSEENSGGLIKDYTVFQKDACLATGPHEAQAVASFAFRVNQSELMDVNVIRKSSAVGLVTMGEVVPLQGLPKLIQVSTWSRVASSPALQAAFATAAALVGLFSMLTSFSSFNKDDPNQQKGSGNKNTVAQKPRGKIKGKSE